MTDIQQGGHTLKAGHVLKGPESSIAFNGTIRYSNSNPVTGYPFGFVPGTGHHLGLIKGYSFDFDQKLVGVEGASFSDSRLIEYQGDELKMSFQVSSFNYETLRALLPNSWRSATHASNGQDIDRFYMSVGGEYEVIDADFKPLAIHVTTCSYDANGLVESVTGMYITVYKAICTNPFAIELGKNTPTINLEFNAIRDLTKEPRNQLFGVAIYSGSL